MGRSALLISYSDDFAIKEGKGLAEAAGYEVVGVLTQRYLTRAKFGVGEGKAIEARELAKEENCDVILFDEQIKSVQKYNLAKITGVEIIDREKLILQIFNRRASTAEAKLQIKLAELEYEMTRAREMVRLAKQGEQPGFYGLGKYEVDVYYQAIRRRISFLNSKLRNVARRRELYRTNRQRRNIPVVSLAGYTGAGKTSLFNALTSAGKEVSNKAFTTLGTSTRAAEAFGKKFLVSDTVGFITNLPTYMIEAFKSTLEELTFADIVLLVTDISDPRDIVAIKNISCHRILSDLQVSPSKLLNVLNKVDLTDLSEDKSSWIELGENSVLISAKTGYGIDKLMERIEQFLFDETKVSPERTYKAVNLGEEQMVHELPA